jgi:rod shape-determining protein MreD
MGNYIGIPILILAAILNATVMPELRVGGGAPDLVFLLVVSWALLADVRGALAWAFVGGVLQDWFSIAPLGTSSLGLVTVAFVADSLFGQVHRSNLLIPPLVAAGGTVIYHLGVLTVLWMTDMRIAPGQGLLYVTLPTLIYNVIFIVPIFRALGVVHHWLHPHRARVE